MGLAFAMARLLPAAASGHSAGPLPPINSRAVVLRSDRNARGAECSSSLDFAAMPSAGIIKIGLDAEQVAAGGWEVVPASARRFCLMPSLTIFCPPG